MIRSMLKSAAAAGAVVAMTAAGRPARAQTPAAPPGSGPMTVERIHSDWVIAPEAKVTRFDGQTDVLAGASGGIVIDDALFVGAAGYWLPDNHRGHKLGYGGGVVQWRVGMDRPIGFSLGSLLGFGTATVSRDVYFEPLYNRAGQQVQPATIQSFAYRRDFVVAEPEADLLLNFAPQARLRIGAGYRATGDDRGVGNRINGATGIVSLEFGGHNSR